MLEKFVAVIIQGDSKLCKYLRRLLGRSFWAQSVNITFFTSSTVSELRRFNVDVALHYCCRLTGAPRWEFVEVQTVEGQLSGSDSRPVTSPSHTNRKVLKRITMK
jgi:hypothetical protein